jgi:hypothetical protein
VTTQHNADEDNAAVETSTCPASGATCHPAGLQWRRLNFAFAADLCLITALPSEAFCLVAHPVERDNQPVNAFEQLKAALTQCPTTSTWSRWRRWAAASQVMAVMLKLWPCGHQGSPFFGYSFLQCLSQEIWVLLTEDVASLQAIEGGNSSLVSWQRLTRVPIPPPSPHKVKTSGREFKDHAWGHKK